MRSRYLAAGYSRRPDLTAQRFLDDPARYRRVPGRSGIVEEALRGQIGPPPVARREIAVRSRYLAAGYWRRPDLTAQRFLDDPERPGTRLYRTGDVGRFQPGGLLEHLGRVDGLAKIRGQRVEAAEVESALLAVPGVAAAGAGC